MSAPQSPNHPDGIRTARVDVNGEVVTLTFLGDLTPVEAVAVFLRDLADAADNLEAAFLNDIADRLDPPQPAPR